jgi:hypothetical protein
MGRFKLFAFLLISIFIITGLLELLIARQDGRAAVRTNHIPPSPVIRG